MFRLGKMREEYDTHEYSYHNNKISQLVLSIIPPNKSGCDTICISIIFKILLQEHWKGVGQLYRWVGRKTFSCSRQNTFMFSQLLNLCPDFLTDACLETSETSSTLIVQILYLSSVLYALVPAALTQLNAVCLESNSFQEEACFPCALFINFLPRVLGFFVAFSTGAVRPGVLMK